MGVLARLVVASLALLSGLGGATANFTTIETSLTGQVQILHSHEIGKLEMLMAEDEMTGELIRSLPIPVKKLSEDTLTGDRVKLKVRAKIPSTYGNHMRSLLNAIQYSELMDIEVTDTEMIKASVSKDFIVNGNPVELTSATVIASMCDVQNRLTKEDVLNSWFGSAEGTLEKTFERCSHGKLLWKRDKNIVTEMTMPCKGTRPDESNPLYTYNFDSENSCTHLEWDSWRYFAIQHMKSIGIDLFSLKRLLIIVPNRVKCGWAGLGWVGCPAGSYTCTAWIQDYNPVSIGTTFHELMHNTGLYHGNRWTSDGVNIEYGDPTDPMGSAGPTQNGQNIVCLTAPQSWKAGWMNLLSEVHVDNVANDVYLIPAFGKTDRTMMRIVLGSVVNDRQLSMFISYRSRSDMFDTGLGDFLNGRVYVHLFNGTTLKPRADPWDTPPVLKGILDVGAKAKDVFFWWERDVRYKMNVSSVFLYKDLRIDMLGSTPDQATIRICKKSATEDTEQTCLDGVDNDCDGLVDADDPDCATVFNTPVSPPSMPAPPRPPPPSPPPPSPRQTRRPHVPRRPANPPKRRKSPPPPRPPPSPKRVKRVTKSPAI